MLTKEQINSFEIRAKEAVDSWNPVEVYLELASDYFTLDESFSSKAFNLAEKQIGDIDDALLLAEFTCQKMIGNENKHLDYYKKVDVLLEDTGDYISFAESIIKFLKDNNWAENIYRRALKDASFDGVMLLVISVKEFIKNPQLLIELYTKADELALNTSYYHKLHEDLLEFSSEEWAMTMLNKGHKVEVSIEAYTITGNVAEFIDEESESIKDYCSTDINDQDIETLISGPDDEDLLREILEDEDFDLYDNASESDLSMEGNFPVFNESFKLLIKVNNNIQEINLNDVKVKTDLTSLVDWKNEKKEEDALAYSFGYISDSVKLFEFSFYSRNKDLDLNMLVLNIQNNEFFETSKYLVGIEYDMLDLDYDETVDFEGEYFNGIFFNSIEED